MAQLTAISIGPRALRVVSARETTGGVEILRAASAPLPEDFPARPPEERAKLLREALAKCGGANGRAALVIPRGLAILRNFDLPEGAPEEIAQMVRFQVEKELPMPVEEARYSHVESAAPQGKVHVSVAAAPKDQVEALMSALGSAGCRPQAAYVSSFGLAALVPGKDASAVVALGDGGAEIAIIEGGAVAASRSAPIRDFSAEGLATEVSRTILSHAARGTAQKVGRILICGEGPKADRAAAELTGRLNEPVEQLVLDGAIRRQAGVVLEPEAIAAAGICVGILRGRPPMPDLLRPPIARKKLRLKPAHRTVILSVLAAAGLVLWSQSALADRRAELGRLKAELKSLEPKAQEIGQTRARVRLASQWMDDRYPWIEMFNAIQAKIDTKKIWLTSCVIEETGSLRVQGKATAKGEVTALISQLQKDPAFQKAEEEYTKPIQGRSEYKVDFAIKIQLAGLSAPKKK